MHHHGQCAAHGEESGDGGDTRPDLDTEWGACDGETEDQCRDAYAE
jgi:hypothetical protein